MEEKGWSVLATYSSGLDADIAMGQLEQAGIPALRDSHNAAGIFGYSFQGTTPQGFTVRVPDPNAEVWFQNYRTQQNGTVRQFQSQALDPNSTYTFQVRARWMQNGQMMDQTRARLLELGFAPDKILTNY